MVQTRRINNNRGVIVSFDPTTLLIRKPGKAEYGNERKLVSVEGDTIKVNTRLAAEFGLTVRTVS